MNSVPPADWEALARALNRLFDEPGLRLLPVATEFFGSSDWKKSRSSSVALLRTAAEA
jgi:hypothetical protein